MYRTKSNQWEIDFKLSLNGKISPVNLIFMTLTMPPLCSKERLNRPQLDGISSHHIDYKLDLYNTHVL